MNELAIVVSECACKTCKGYCDRPGWPTPEEAGRLMDLGYASRMMLDYWGSDDDLPYTEIVCPAHVGREGKCAPLWPHGVCTLQDPESKLCEIHNSGAKPIECRVAHHSLDEMPAGAGHLDIARLWNSDAGRAAVARWNAITEAEAAKGASDAE